MNGYYVPDSMFDSYVANKRDDTGKFIYESASDDIGIAKQQAVQTLERNYAQTIENAYSSYLAANKNILGSQMGQGYKEAYLENQRQALQQNIAQAGLTAANYRQDLEAQSNAAQEKLMAAFQTEVGNFDRAALSMQDYLGYLKSLSNKEGQGYLTKEQLKIADDKNYGIDNLYEVLLNAQPESFEDAQGNAGMSFLEWTRSKLGTSASDDAYRQWLYGQGGYQELRPALIAKSQKREQERLAAEEQERLAAEKAKKEREESDHILGDDEATVGEKWSGSAYGPKIKGTTVEINGQKYRIGKSLDIEPDYQYLDKELTDFYNKTTNETLTKDKVIKYNGQYYISYQASNFSPVHWRQLTSSDSTSSLSKIDNGEYVDNSSSTDYKIGNIEYQRTNINGKYSDITAAYKSKYGEPKTNSIIKYNGEYYVYRPIGSKKAARKAGRTGNWYKLAKK